MNNVEAPKVLSIFQTKVSRNFRLERFNLSKMSPNFQEIVISKFWQNGNIGKHRIRNFSINLLGVQGNSSGRRRNIAEILDKRFDKIL